MFLRPRSGACIISIVLLSMLFAEDDTRGAPFLRGDANNDRVVDISDSLFLLSYLFLGDPPQLSCADAADTNDSGKADISDSIFLYGYLFYGTVDQMHPPFPECGVDPTPDELDCVSSACDGSVANPGVPETEAWIDTRADNSLIQEAGLFSVDVVGGEPVLMTRTASFNVHSHYVSPSSAEWESYEFSGKMRRDSQEGGGIGVTFLSDYPNNDRYYRLRQIDHSDFHIAPHGTQITFGQVNSMVRPLPDVWYRFLIEVNDTSLRTEIRAKIWAEGEAEPSQWQIDCYDSSPTRIRTGTVGCWSMGPDSQLKMWADFRIGNQPVPFSSDLSEAPQLVLNSTASFLRVGQSAELSVVRIDSRGPTDITGEATFALSDPSVGQITPGAPAILTATRAGIAEIVASHSGVSSAPFTISVISQVLPEPGSPVSVFSSQAEVSGISRKIQLGEQPWTNAFNKVISNANGALSRSPISVVDNGAPAGASGNPHRFGTDDPYSTDGVLDPNADRTDYFRARDIGHWVRDLGIAYALTGEDPYARKCIDLLYHWTLNPATYMEPRVTNYGPHRSGTSSGGAIEIYITIPKLFYAAGLVSGHGYWQSKGASAEGEFLAWTRSLLEDASGKSIPTNNIGAWLLLLRASAAALLDDGASLQSVYDEWRDLADVQIDGEGKMVRELHRTLSLHYSLYGLKALTLTAEIAKQRGVNLYDYDGALRRAFDYHVPYLKDPSSWPHEQIGRLDGKDAAASYEFAHSFWADPDYLSVLNSIGRPMDSNYVMGYTTLMHGDLFRLD